MSAIRRVESDNCHTLAAALAESLAPRLVRFSSARFEARASSSARFRPSKSIKPGNKGGGKACDTRLLLPQLGGDEHAHRAGYYPTAVSVSKRPAAPATMCYKDTHHAHGRHPHNA